VERQEEIKEILLNILQIGILNVRVCAWGGQVERCAIEADHIHNLPGLVRYLNIELLLHYYNVSRLTFLRQAAGTTPFEQDWERLGKILAKIPVESS